MSYMALAGTTLTQLVTTVVAAIVVFVADLVLVLKLSRYGDRQQPGGQGLRPGSFGSDDEEDNAGAPGYGRPAGYGPPPLWTDTPGNSSEYR